MAAKKSPLKVGKAKKPAAAKPAAKKAVVAKRPAATPTKSAAPIKLVAPVKSAATIKAAAPVRLVPAKLPAANKAKTLASEPVVTKVLPIKRVADAGDDEGADNGLLAGPRNVQPYIIKRGEQYMNKVQLGHFREILQTWKQDLMLEVDRTVSHMKDEAANFPDPNDRATQEEEFSLELRTRDRERKLIRKIDEAIKRIEDGSYGYCLETGEQIGVKRLEARPVATLSIEAQERRERREKQYGDRDDRYR
jgi:DnaK suppressor protein